MKELFKYKLTPCENSTRSRRFSLETIPINNSTLPCGENDEAVRQCH
jgi:hypothetical protein